MALRAPAASRRSRTRPISSGRSAASGPCRTRPTSSTSKEGDQATRTEPHDEAEDRDAQQPPVAVHVPEPAEQRYGDGGGEELCGVDPVEVARPDVEDGAEFGQQGRHHPLDDAAGEFDEDQESDDRGDAGAAEARRAGRPRWAGYATWGSPLGHGRAHGRGGGWWGRKSSLCGHFEGRERAGPGGSGGHAPAGREEAAGHGPDDGQIGRARGDADGREGLLDARPGRGRVWRRRVPVLRGPGRGAGRAGAGGRARPCADARW